MMMKDIEVLVKDAYADGVDMETLLSKVRVAYEIEKAAAAESERHEASIAAARRKVAEAMYVYMEAIDPELISDETIESIDDNLKENERILHTGARLLGRMKATVKRPEKKPEVFEASFGNRADLQDAIERFMRNEGLI